MTQYEEALNWLNKLASEKQFFHEKSEPSLKAMNQILDFLGRPDKFFQYRIIVGGTAGKGTVCRYIEQTLLCNGKSTALISSPHIQVVTERVRINGKLISCENFGSTILEIKKVSEEIKVSPTYYESIVLAGILSAQKAGVEILVCEVGIGGAMDGVNAVQGKRIAALTFVGNDHLEMFNDSIEELAIAKGGIFTKESILNISYEQKFRSILEKTPSNNILFLKGIKQKMNKKIARKVCEQILSSNGFTMRSSKLPCRWEKINKNMILDVAHSAPRFEYILPRIKKISGKKSVLIGMVKNYNFKDLSIILDEFDDVFWTRIKDKDSHDPQVMQKHFKRGTVIEDLDLFIKDHQDTKTLIIGSFYLCGAVRELFYPSESIAEQQTEFPL